ncbi:hypothetical protein A3C87_01210 [Candidatus Kaiserbacteria bacterium RIFCSPHIGHO2_02_FULL_49_34]|uniref:ROK family protein n=1 Tax=Candidatus Kaiserbacteria bacterium RIFCSPHIGHO2_02_FULL_49_34 TaxID=1798491 RepID=A0A1F6DMD5_9BACT|nr:MAG: hypothetical protein A3C87_01210 [Candidatus Kaiserbacteria bacterium RIFCSPHIGHO2_02_FULL_49_34]
MIIAIDIGGATLKVASYEHDALSVPLRRTTPREFAAGFSLIKDLVRQAAGEGIIDAIVIGVRGILAEDGRRIERDTVLLNWVGKPLSYLLEHEFKVPVTLAPASMCAAHADTHAEPSMYFNVGAGVSAATHEKAIHSHDMLDALDATIGGLAVTGRRGVHPYEIPLDDTYWRHAADYLAHGIAQLAKEEKVSIVVLGGAMILGYPKISIPDTIQSVHKLIGADSSPTIVPTRHGDNVVLVGAVRLLI